jgi:Cytochrome P460
MRHVTRFKPALAVVAVITVVDIGFLTGHAAEQPQRGDIEMSDISGDLQQPRRHFRVRNPANLAPKEAVKIYGIIAGALHAGYQHSGVKVAELYQTWQRYNTAPYLSPSHGNHYLNNYANDMARAYGTFEQAGALPVGAIVAKDSFSVTASRSIVLGPLFIMEKMPPGFSYVTGDWKFIQVQPDGTLLGETNGVHAERVEYCIGCHLAAVAHDYLYFVPQKYRISRKGENRDQAAGDAANRVVRKIPIRRSSTQWRNTASRAPLAHAQVRSGANAP